MQAVGHVVMVVRLLIRITSFLWDQEPVGRRIWGGAVSRPYLRVE